MNMEFLYFPQDKSEYLPAFISLSIFIIGAILAVYFFYRYSKKEEQKFEEKYNLKQHEEHENNTKSKRINSVK